MIEMMVQRGEYVIPAKLTVNLMANPKPVGPINPPRPPDPRDVKPKK